MCKRGASWTGTDNESILAHVIVSSGESRRAYQTLFMLLSHDGYSVLDCSKHVYIILAQHSPEDIGTFLGDVRLRFRDCRNVAENDAETVQPAGLPRCAASDRRVKV